MECKIEDELKRLRYRVSVLLEEYENSVVELKKIKELHSKKYNNLKEARSELYEYEYLIKNKEYEDKRVSLTGDSKDITMKYLNEYIQKTKTVPIEVKNIFADISNVVANLDEALSAIEDIVYSKKEIDMMLLHQNGYSNRDIGKILDMRTSTIQTNIGYVRARITYPKYFIQLIRYVESKYSVNIYRTKYYEGK